MKEAIVNSDLSVEIKETPIPSAGEHQIVIKVVVSGMNPKDWKLPKAINKALNSGDDIAGIVHSVGPKVYEFQPGDRVAAFHEMVQPGGSFAEYALAWDYTTFRIPESVSFEEAATVPLAAMTAAVSLFQDLRVPEPWSSFAPIRAQEGQATKLPIVIYGASSATGAFGAQLARLSGMKPIIGVGGRNQKLAKELFDHVVDYRDGEDSVVKGIEGALEKEGLPAKVKYAFDAISEHGSYRALRRVVDQNGGRATVLLGSASSKGPTASADDFDYPEGVTLIQTSVGNSHNKSKDLAYVWFRFISRAMEDGRFKGHPYEVIPGGLGGLSQGLQNLSEGKASGLKYVFRIAEST